MSKQNQQQSQPITDASAAQHTNSQAGRTGKSTGQRLNAATVLLHAIPVDPLTGAVSVPIYQTSTFVQQRPGVHAGYDYARTNNPTREALEKLLAGLEHGAGASAFASGLAAIDAVAKLLSAGDEIVAVNDIYGGAYRLFTHIYEKLGIRVKYVDTTNVENVLDALTPETKLIWLESPTNPTLRISDIAAIASLARGHGALLCVDNTFASPALQQPILLGADLVVHSATKYLGGHSDLIAGAVVSATEELAARVRFVQNAGGAVLSPQDSFLVIRGIETLYLRVRQHCENAQAVAEYLAGHPAVAAVHYPGLSTHPNHAVAARQQQGGFGGVVSFVLREDTPEAAERVVCSTRLFKLAESLGGVKSLVCHPATMTHKSIPTAQRHAAGVADSLIRLSVGLEHAEDLINDLEAALSVDFSDTIDEATEAAGAAAFLIP